MKRRSHNTKSTNKPIDKSPQKQSRRKSRHTVSNNSSLIFSEIPRAALPESSLNQYVFQKETPSRANLFEPATSECDYLQYQQPFQIYSQKTQEDSLQDGDSSKREHFWRILEHNNQVGSRRSSNSQSSCQFQKTSKKWSSNKGDNQEMKYQMIKYKTIREEEEIKTQTSAINTENQQLQADIKRSNSFSISKKEIDLKITPRRDYQRESNSQEYLDEMNENQNVFQARKNKDLTAQKRVSFASMLQNPSRIRPLHKIKRRPQPGQVWLQKLSYVQWNKAGLENKVQKRQRYNKFPQRKTRIVPLKYWLGQRIVYKGNDLVGVKLNQIKQ